MAFFLGFGVFAMFLLRPRSMHAQAARSIVLDAQCRSAAKPLAGLKVAKRRQRKRMRAPRGFNTGDSALTG
jgi:hypothetical protein